MVRFEKRSTPPNYLARREQRRLLTLVLLLGVVFFVMHHASKPSSWYWFVALSQPMPVTSSGGDIDTRLLPATPEATEPGEFVSPAPKPSQQPEKREYFPGVEPEHFESIRDDTVFRGAEHEAFFNLLGVLQENEFATLEAASTGPAAFVQLFRQPDEYRGRLVSVQGTMRRAVKVSASKNDLGIEAYYQTWIQPYDNPNFPLVLYVLELPPGMPTGLQMQEEVEFTGFFFKRWAYRAQDSIRTTPLLLAKTVAWERPVAASEGPSPLTLAGIAAAGLAIGGVVLFMALRSGRPPDPYQGLRPPREATYAAGEEISPGEVLKRLAEAPPEGEASPAATPGKEA